MRVERRRNPWKGLLAGGLGGFVGSFAMSEFHSLLQSAERSSQHSKEDSTVRAASAISQYIFHHELTVLQKKIAGPVVHCAFGTGVAAMYGALVEFGESLRAGWGVPFGAAVWLGAHVITVPALGLSETVTRSTPAAEAAEFGAHLVYGVVAEGVRLFMRTHLLR
jgi:putative membrane protein